MPTAICNTCHELITYVHRPGNHQKKQVCGCGSTDLTAVKVVINYTDDTYEYYDRGGNVRKSVPRNVPHETKCIT